MAALHARAFSVPRPWSETEFAEMLASIHTFAVAEAQGFALGRAVAGEAELLTICVAPEARRQGIARRLIAAIEAAARLRRADSLILEVAADNAAAIALYRGAGFAATARRAGYYHHPDGGTTDAVIMAKPVLPASVP